MANSSSLANRESSPTCARQYATRSGLLIGAGYIAWFGIPKVLLLEPMASSMASAHFSRGATVTFGVLEVLGAIGLLVPRTRHLALAGLVLLMTGAIAIHVGVGDFPSEAVFALVGFALYLVLAVATGGRALRQWLWSR